MAFQAEQLTEGTGVTQAESPVSGCREWGEDLGDQGLERQAGTLVRLKHTQHMQRCEVRQAHKGLWTPCLCLHTARAG
jgi:hypothetical protein